MNVTIRVHTVACVEPFGRTSLLTRQVPCCTNRCGRCACCILMEWIECAHQHEPGAQLQASRGVHGMGYLDTQHSAAAIVTKQRRHSCVGMLLGLRGLCLSEQRNRSSLEWPRTPDHSSQYRQDRYERNNDNGDEATLVWSWGERMEQGQLTLDTLIRTKVD